MLEYIPITPTRGVTFDTDDPDDWGYCTWCGRNSISCECDEDDE